MTIIITLGLFFSIPEVQPPTCSWYLPLQVENRQAWENVRLTKIGDYALLRNARPGIPAHLHTGVDLARPGENYANEPVFPAAHGVVISQRTDGPFAQIIVEHAQAGSDTVWTVYEHVAGIEVVVGDTVTPQRPLARFMTRAELNKYGWQFDHVHFEIVKHRPRPLEPTPRTPMRLFKIFNLECYTKADLERYYHNPQVYFEVCWQRESGIQ